MSKNIFYKALASVSTAGIIALAGAQISIALRKGNNAEEQLVKEMISIKNARKDAFSEVKGYKDKKIEFNFSEIKQLRLKRVDALRQCIHRARDQKELRSCRPSARN